MDSSVPISIRRFHPEHHLPHLVLDSASTSAGWNGCIARLYDLPEGVSETETPAFHEHHLIVQLSGYTDVDARFDGATEHAESTPGKLAVISAGTGARWRSRGLRSELLLLFLEPALLATIGRQTVDLDGSQVELVRRFLTPDPLIFQIAVALGAELRSPGPASRLYTESLTHTLGVHLLRHHAVVRGRLGGTGGWLQAALLRLIQEHIESHLHEDLTLAELAALAGLSPYHFARLFKQSTGQTVHAFVTERRLAAGRRMLEAGALSAAEIAALVGFVDQSHFSRHFKRAFGMSPGRYRRQRTILLLSRTDLQDSQG